MVLVAHGQDLSGTSATRKGTGDAGTQFFNEATGAQEHSDGSNWLGGAGGMGSRVELLWRAGQAGKPGINADVLSATEAVRMIVDPNFEILGTNATSALCTFNAEGGLTLTTAGADGDSMILAPHLDANLSPWSQVTWGTDKSVRWECCFTTGAAITNAIIWAGLKLTNTPVTITDDDQVFFRYESDVVAGDIQAVYSIGGTDVAVDTNIAVAVSTVYRLVIAIDSSRIATMFVNGTLVATSTALTDTTDLIPYLAVEADGAAEAKAITVYGQSISRDVG